jgi:dTDP-glucose pyrophosphorylase
MGFIDEEQVESLAEHLKNNGYDKYLLNLIEEGYESKEK